MSLFAKQGAVVANGANSTLSANRQRGKSVVLVCPTYLLPLIKCNLRREEENTSNRRITLQSWYKLKVPGTEWSQGIIHPRTAMNDRRFSLTVGGRVSMGVAAMALSGRSDSCRTNRGGHLCKSTGEQARLQGEGFSFGR